MSAKAQSPCPLPPRVTVKLSLAGHVEVTWLTEKAGKQPPAGYGADKGGFEGTNGPSIRGETTAGSSIASLLCSSCGFWSWEGLTSLALPCTAHRVSDITSFLAADDDDDSNEHGEVMRHSFFLV